MTRECGECTACCDGTLEGRAFGHDFSPGTPCVAVMLGKGCARYDDRPPTCREFECAWKADPTYPEDMRPDSVNAVAVVRAVDGQPYAELVESAYGKVDATTVLRFLSWSVGSVGNAKVSAGDQSHYFGSADFCEAMQRA